MLSKDKQRFDRNGDGRLSGFEYSDYYDYTYGIDDQDAEQRVLDEAEDSWSAWLGDAVARLQGNYADVVHPAEIIMGKSAQTRELAEKTFMHFLTLGLLSGSRWHETRSSGGGMYTSSSIFMPYKSAVRHIIDSRISVCTYEDVNRAVMSCSPLFETEGILTNKRVGSFWRALFRAMPSYRPNAMTHFSETTRSPAPNEKDDAKIAAFNLLLESLLPVFTYFSGRPNAEALTKCRQYTHCAEKHWKDGGW